MIERESTDLSHTLEVLMRRVEPRVQYEHVYAAARAVVFVPPVLTLAGVAAVEAPRWQHLHQRRQEVV
jgi:hypothetical protein